jgi:predicted AAA+ superfamily ATPase
MLKSVAIEQVLERLRFENPWWKDSAIDPYFDRMPRRSYFRQFSTLCRDISVHRSIILMGPRRVGKTVMLFHLVHDLIGQGVPPRRILFITVENPIYNNLNLEDLFKNARKAVGQEEDIKGWFVIFDEIQYLKDWNVHLKSLVDSYRKVRFIVSGSAAAALKYKSTESGAGRCTEFMLPPLTFYEFINMQQLGYLLKDSEMNYRGSKVPYHQATDIRELNQQFVHYINYGGYPEAIFSETIRNNPERFIRNDVIDKVLLRDLPGLYGISNVQELNSLFTTIAYNTAQEFSIETLSRQSGSPKSTIKKYLEYLEAAFLIKIVRRVDQSGKRFQRDNLFKIYLTNPSMRSALFSPIESIDEAMGAQTETAIYAQWMHRLNFTPYYVRWSRGEIDMTGIDKITLKPKWVLEIKWTDRYVTKPSEMKSLIRFCKENNLPEALITSTTIEKQVHFEGVNLNFIPASVYAYTIGLNTLTNKS